MSSSPSSASASASRPPDGDRWGHVALFLHEHQRALRITAVWVPALGCAIALSRLPPFRQVSRAADLPLHWVAKHRRLRGRIMDLGNGARNREVLHFYHTPLARNVLWFDLKVVRPEHCLPVRIAGVRVHEPAHLPRNEDVYAQIVSVDKGKNEVSVILRSRTLIPFTGRDFGLELLREGAASLSEHDSNHLVASRVALSKHFPRQLKRMQRAQDYAHRNRLGVWSDMRRPSLQHDAWVAFRTFIKRHWTRFQAWLSET